MASINEIAGKYLKEFCDRGNFVYYNTLAVYKKVIWFWYVDKIKCGVVNEVWKSHKIKECRI